MRHRLRRIQLGYRSYYLQLNNYAEQTTCNINSLAIANVCGLCFYLLLSLVNTCFYFEDAILSQWECNALNELVIKRRLPMLVLMRSRWKSSPMCFVISASTIPIIRDRPVNRPSA